MVPSLNAGAFLVFLLSFKACVLLAQLLFQIMVLLGEALYGSGESLNLSLEGGRAWFVSLSIVGGCHQVSKYHVTLCLGSDNMTHKSQFSTDGANR